MPDVLIKNVDSSVIDRLTEFANQNNRSLEDEIKVIFAEVANESEAEIEAEFFGERVSAA